MTASTTRGSNAAAPSGTAPAGHEGLTGKMGTLEVIFTVLAYNAPLLAFMGFLPVMILSGNGLGTPVLHIAVGALILLIATGLMKVSETLKRPGGFYAFTTAGLGREAGLATGFASIVTYFAALIANSVLAGIAFSDMMESLLHVADVPWPIGTLPVLIIVSVLGYLNINFSAKVLTYFLALELLLIAVYCWAVFARGGASGISFASLEPQHVLSGSIAIGGLFAVGLFGGFEATVIFRDEVRRPEKTIPRATYAVVVLITIVYAVAAFALINAYGADVVMNVLANDVVSASGQSVKDYVGPWAYNFAVALLFTSSLAGTLAAHNVLTRYVFNLSADGVLPSSLSATHSKHRSPHRASLVTTAGVVIILGILAATLLHNNSLYGYIAGVYSYGMLAMMVLVTLGIAVLLVRKVAKRRLHATLIFAASAVMALVLVFASFNFDLLSGMSGVLGATVLALIWVFILSGVVIALRLKRRRPDVYAKIGRQ